jgi:hypothetical protein
MYIVEAYPPALTAGALTVGSPLSLAFARDDAEGLRVATYLYEMAPEMLMIHQTENSIRPPIFYAIVFGSIDVLKYLLQLCPEAAATKSTVRKLLPLHRLLNRPYYHLSTPYKTNVAEKVRILLRYDPLTASALNSEGATPYSIAVSRGFPDAVKRLLLRADPSIDPAELHRLNYAERRMAMFLAFSAISSSATDSFAIRLRRLKTHAGTDMPLLRLVVSFL